MELFSDPNEADQSKDKFIIPNNKNSFLFSSASNSDIINTTFCSNNNNINHTQNLPKKENVDISNSKNTIFNKTNVIKIELIKKEPNKSDENAHNKNISENKSNNKEYNLDQKNKNNNKIKMKNKKTSENIINNDKDFSDIEQEIYIKNIFKQYHLDENDIEDAIVNLKILFNEYKNK